MQEASGLSILLGSLVFFFFNVNLEIKVISWKNFDLAVLKILTIILGILKFYPVLIFNFLKIFFSHMITMQKKKI